jgi:hypothetical protein
LCCHVKSHRGGGAPKTHPKTEMVKGAVDLSSIHRIGAEGSHDRTPVSHWFGDR